MNFNPVLWATNAADSFCNSLALNINEFFKELTIGFMSISTEVCIIAGLIGTILYLFGWKKCRNVPFISYAIYFIIQILGGILLG